MHKKPAFWLFAIVGLYLLIFGKFYFGRNHLPTHDFDVAYASGHIVSNYLLNGQLPLWAPEQNSGAPVWPDSETYPGYDPISLAVNFTFGLLGGDSISAHVTTMLLWHLVFCAGIFVLFQRLGLSTLASLFGFTIVLCSSLTALNFRQTDDYVTIYRYVPWIFVTLIGFFKNPTLKNALALGLVGGLATCGYHTPNIVILLACVFISLIPLRKKFTKAHARALVPAIVLAVCLNAPLLWAALYWVQNIANAREFFPGGYRGSSADLFAPLGNIIHNETFLFLGVLPSFLALFGFLGLVNQHWTKRKIAYWPHGFLISLSCLIWVLYIGAGELFGGVNDTFFWIRSFNNMLPYLLGLVAFFCCYQLDQLLAAFKKSRGLPKVPLLGWLVLGAAGLTLLNQLPRTLLLTQAFHRAGNNTGFENTPPIFVLSPLDRLSWEHGLLTLVFVLLMAAVLTTYIRKKAAPFVLALGALTVLEMGLLNRHLMEMYFTSKPEDPHHTLPRSTAPLPSEPPVSRARRNQIPGRWFKQMEVVYHLYAARSHRGATWFSDKQFRNFVDGLNSLPHFDAVAGVSQPILYFAHQVIPAPPQRVLASIQGVSPALLKHTLIVDGSSWPSYLPTRVPFSDKNSYRIEGYSPNHIELTASAPNGAYLVYADSYSPDWKVTVDGKPTELIRANYQFKSVWVPEGSHRIEFRYQPLGYLLAFWMRFFALVAGLSVLLFLSLRKEIPRKARRKRAQK